MATLVVDPKSCFWYLQRKVNGKWVKTSTGLRRDDPDDTRKARILRAQAEAKEHEGEIFEAGGWDWVESCLTNSGLAPRSIEKYLTNWKWLQQWVTECRLDVRTIRYKHALQYVEWRTARRKRTGKRAGRNTAIQEVKLLSSILNEAVRREKIDANPLASLRLKKDPAKKKPAFKDEEVDICRAALLAEPEWMRISFEIALATGCRLRDTRIPLECVDLKGRFPVMTFPSPKGGTDKAFSIPVPSVLMPLFQKMKRERRSHTIEAFPFQPSRAWQHFFKRVGLPHLMFHCLRVTKVTRLRREGVPREAAMRLVNHSQEMVHLLYDRHQVQDLAEFRDAGIAGSCVSKG